MQGKDNDRSLVPLGGCATIAAIPQILMFVWCKDAQSYALCVCRCEGTAQSPWAYSLGSFRFLKRPVIPGYMGTPLTYLCHGTV